jgi:hypothetical protein
MIGYFHSANFKTWPNALHSCFQMVLMDEWVDLMNDASVAPPSCTIKFDNQTTVGYHGITYSWGDCGSEYAPILFVIFKLTCEAVMLNLVVGEFHRPCCQVSDSLAFSFVLIPYIER